MAVDLQSRADVAALVRAFYEQALRDPLLGPIFVDIVRIDLDHHLPIITDFWETVLFDANRYRRNLLQLHRALDRRVPLQAQHFDRWLHLWGAAVDGRYAGEKAELAKGEAARVAWSLQATLQGRSPSGMETIPLRQQLPVRTRFRAENVSEAATAEDRGPGTRTTRS